jgi:hypothetical protein
MTEHARWMFLFAHYPFIRVLTSAQPQSIHWSSSRFFLATYAYSQVLKAGPPFSIQGIGQSFSCVTINEDLNL